MNRLPGGCHRKIQVGRVQTGGDDSLFETERDGLSAVNDGFSKEHQRGFPVLKFVALEIEGVLPVLLGLPGHRW